MKQLSNIRLLLMAICTVFMLGSCSDFPDEMYFDGNIVIEDGEAFYDTETNTYTQELIIDVNVTEASEDITRAYIKIGDKEIDFTNKINKRKGGKAKVRIDELRVSETYKPEIFVESSHFKHSEGHYIHHSNASFCKISNFRISPKDDPYEGADVSFRIEDNPTVNQKPITLEVGNISIPISNTSEKGDYHYDLDIINLGTVNQCRLLIDNNQITDYVEYTTPAGKAVIEVNDKFVSRELFWDIVTYDLTAGVKDYYNILGNKSFQLWTFDGNYKYYEEDPYSSGRLSLRHSYYYGNNTYYNKTKSCQFRLYVDGELWAVTTTTYYDR